MALGEISLIEPLLSVLAYLIGSISSAVVLCRIFGLDDPRTTGSGNPGATNVLRQGGKLVAALTLLGDVMKGAIPLLVGIQLSLSTAWLGVIGVAAFIGHLFPLYFRFKGGKGVATFFGVISVLSWQLALLALICWIICAWAFRVSSLSALITAVIIPVYSWQFFPIFFWPIVIMCILLVIRHHQNIKNLLNGGDHPIRSS